MPLLRADNLRKDYGHADGPVLDGISLTVEPGESVAIVGPSGSGKSTLLHLLGGLDSPTDGSVTLDGRHLTDMTDRQRAAFRARSLGFVFQSHHLLPQFTVLENVLAPVLALRPRTTADDLLRAHDLIGRVGLEHRASQLPAQLSGGERQRTALVRALINQPRILLADEPTGSLDSHHADALADLLVRLNHQQGTALVVVTHSPDLAARMDRTLTLRAARLHPAPQFG